jgi:hypothetical protein
MKLKFLLSIVSVISTLSFSAYAKDGFDLLEVREVVTVDRAETESIDLGSKHFVRNIIVQAEGYGSASTVEVYVNGHVKGTIYAPGVDPTYLVTIEETASSIEFRHVAGGSMHIHDLKAYVRENISYSSHTYYSPNGVEAIGRKIVDLVDQITPYSTLSEERIYLLPLKKKAAQVIVMSSAHGELSSNTRTALEDMIKQFKFSRKYFDHLLEEDAMFDLTVDLMTIDQAIQDLID